MKDTLRTFCMTAASRRLALFVLFILFDGIMVMVGSLRPAALLSPFEWGLLALSASLGGAGVAYLGIGEWLRFPLVKVVSHSAGVGEDTEPRYKGLLEAPGILLSCPICSGTWVAGGLYALHAFFPALSMPMLYVLAAGGAVRLLVRHAEKLEWEKHLAWERTGLAHKMNARESQFPFVGGKEGPYTFASSEEKEVCLK